MTGAARLEPFFTEPHVTRQRANRTVATFDPAAVLHREIAARMHERLAYIKIAPTRLLDLGCATGAALSDLQARYPAAQCVALDHAQRRVARAVPEKPLLVRLFRRSAPLGICADMAQLPLADASVELVWSNLALHWLNDPAPAISEARRVLKPNGLFMFSTLGPDSLKELRAASQAASKALHVHRFIDLHDIGDVLVAKGFSTPVMDMETITLTYSTVEQLFNDLRHTGSTNAMQGRARGLMGRARRTKLVEALEAQRATRPDRKFTLSFEIIYGHAWKPEPKAPKDTAVPVRFYPKSERPN